jgi:hypothetical protein
VSDKEDQELPPRSYTVGYCKPPMATRFRPGQSGNPSGRPKGSRTKLPALNDERLKAIILAEAYRTVTVEGPNEPVTVTMAEAIVRSIAVNAAKGNAKAQRLFTDMLGETERANKALHDSFVNTALDFKREWTHAIATALARGLEPPDVTPHPDDIVLDPLTGQIKIRGPLTTEQRDAWDELLAHLRGWKGDIEEFEEQHEATKSRRQRAILADIIARERVAFAAAEAKITATGWRTDRPPRQKDSVWVARFTLPETNKRSGNK